jgi:peptidoglycan hydrolase CwlO-like protein/surface antigen
MLKRQFSKLGQRARILTAGLASLVIVGATVYGGFVNAVSCSSVSDCQAQINNLSAQNLSAQQSVNALLSQAHSYQEAINALQAQIDALQQQIVANQLENDRLQGQIVEAKAQLDQEKKTLGENIQSMYIDGQVTTLEILANSVNLSDFVNQAQYQSSVQNKVKDTLDKIAALKQQLQTQQDQLQQLLKNQQSQQAQLNADQSQQAELLSYNQSQRAQFNSQIAANRSQINALQAKIVALNTPVGANFTYSGSCGGGYPGSAGPGLWGGFWGCNYGQDNTVDNWGMYNRECVSYTAWMVHVEYMNGEIAHDMPNWAGVGNAYQWIADAQNAGIPVDQNPQPGDIAIRPSSGISGDVGHAMYVRTASGGQIYVQQYNADLRGNYSEGWRSSAGLYFLHFAQWQ